jgi:hypothetical protein
MECKKMKLIIRLVGIVVALVALVGCSGSNASHLPSFLASDSLTRIEVINDQTGQKGQASRDLDNLNELLNTLHLGDLTTDAREKAPEPTSSAYTIIASNQAGVVWTVRVLGSPESSRVYISDAVHSANSGIYQLKQSIRSDDLAQFIRKYPAS